MNEKMGVGRGVPTCPPTYLPTQSVRREGESDIVSVNHPYRPFRGRDGTGGGIREQDTDT